MSEQPSAFTETTRIARNYSKPRKPFSCCECGVQINPDDVYVHTSGIWNGDAHSYKQCPDCSLIMDLVSVYVHSKGGEFPCDEVACFRHLRDWFEGFMCVDFVGAEFLEYWALAIEVDINRLGYLLKIEVE